MNNVVVSPQSVIQNDTAGFVFNIVGDEDAQFQSDITDHFVEDNTAVQDHIAVRPERYTLKGFVGELSNMPPFSLGVIADLIPRLSILESFLPTFTTQAKQVYNALSQVQALVGNAIKQPATIYGLFTQKNTNVTQQQNAYNFFRQSWFTRQLMTIQTPYRVYTNMAIENVRVTQRDESNMVSDFSITFKEIRTVKSYASPSVPIIYSGRAENQFATEVVNGQVAGQTPSFTLAKRTNEMLPQDVAA